MPPPSSSQPTPASRGRVEDTAPEITSSLEGQERLQEEPDLLLDKDVEAKKSMNDAESVSERLSVLESQERMQEATSTESSKDELKDNIKRVPDEHLPSHREKQRWDFSKRLSEIMDDLLPKLAVVTQKVNTYTGTDYSGVEALRREIKDQEKLVRARRAAIITAKHTLDHATSQQATAQKEVVALLERKHSWSASDLERYMSLIRSEHVNDQAVREAKEAVLEAESSLEEARTRLEKRERAQYHEEQIWSDTIRRNSTWVTFVLMGVNIFLLLLSLAILEPWRRRRMVREIKTALEAQKMAMEAAPAVSLAPAATAMLTDLAAIEAEIDRLAEEEESVKAALNETTTQSQVEEVIVNPLPSPSFNGNTYVDEASTQGSTAIETEIPTPIQPVPASWGEKASCIAQDIVSDRIISMRRVDYTTAILQGAAAGAVITAAILGLIRSN